MFLVSLIILLVAFAAAAVLLCAGHIPWLREITGGAPLEPEPVVLLAGDAAPDAVVDAAALAADFANSRRAGFLPDVVWGDEPRTRPRPLELPEEGTHA